MATKLLMESADEQILRDILGGEPDQGLLDFTADAGGNSRLLAECAAGLVEEGLVKEYGGTVGLTERRVPGRVVAFVKRRLGDLSMDCQRFLKVAAVLGRSFMLEDVSRMLDKSAASLLSSLEEAISSGFVVAAEHQLVFQSDFLLAGVVESIPAPARGVLQREAMGHSRNRAESHDQKFWVTGHPLWMADRPTGPFEEVAGESRESGESREAGESGEAYSKSHSLIMDGRATAGIRAAERVLSSSASAAPARLDAEASVILGYSLLGMEEAEKRSARILREQGAGTGDVAALMALTALSNARWRAGELGEGLSLGRAAVRYGATADPVWRLHFQLALAGKLANLREFEKAESLINDAEAGLRERGTRVRDSTLAAMRARLFLQAGRVGEARRQAELATEAVDRDAVPVFRPLAYSVLSTIFLYKGDLPAATDCLKRVQGEFETDQAVLYSPQYAWTEVRIAVKREGPRAAVALFSDTYAHLPTQRSLYIEDPAAAAFLVRLALDVGDTELKRSVLETVDGLAGDNPGISVVGLSALHANALVTGDPAVLSRIIAQSPDPLSVALATEELAKIYGAKAPARRRDADWVSSDASRAKPEGVVSSLNSAHWSGLSDMERRIAYLVSVGMTNQQIAKRVHLSAHTVNYHLRKIYRKLDINTRVELARGAAIYSSRAAIYSIEGE
ncbi:LuxR C-terminal-related transcriptional regulator [Streptomyces sp. NBC_00335]|uniref:LuxR family transcriptional regulator n=1 Tax=unclassified Streptomyces TaxID=2593676 RepID=UPI002259E30D|nr:MULTISPECIES: LuxR family transcriptional regulator [unclassified Streptomyces]MCX5404170.1 LuxR C-terminal-related transcriptional regulator [Streptomyces sp. NBC_00086]